MLPYIRQNPFRCSDLTAGYIFMWQDDMDFSFCVWNDTFCVRMMINDQPAYSYPYGKDPDGMVDELIKHVHEMNEPLRIYGVNEEYMEKIRQDSRLQPFCADYDVKWSDYLYDYEKATTFSGKKFSGQRNHVNRFVKLYGKPETSFLEEKDLPDVEEMLERYEHEHEDRGLLETNELERTRELLKICAQLDQHAACIRYQGKIIAFSIGEIIGDMLVIHVEKALREYDGIYPVMYQEFSRIMQDRSAVPLRLVNREDDSGDPGLRISKMQYQPIARVHKYLVHVKSPCAGLTLPVLRDGVLVLDAFREEDIPAYHRLNLDPEVSRYWGYDFENDPYLIGEEDRLFYDSTIKDTSWGDSLNLAIRENDTFIGEVILWHFTSQGDAELGCRIFPEYQHHGYGQRAFKMMTEYAEQQLHLKMNAKCYKENTSSYRMILACGYTLCGEDENFYYFTR